MPPRKQAFTWKLIHDLKLVELVEEKSPFKLPLKMAKKVWIEIADAINSAFECEINFLGAQRHFDLLLSYHKKKQTKNRYE